MVDIGKCAGNCRSSNKSTSAFSSLSCGPREWDALQIGDSKRKRARYEYSNYIVKNCKCSALFSCN